MNTPSSEVPTTEKASAQLLTYLHSELGVWQRLLESGEEPIYGFQRVIRFPDTSSADSVSTVDPFDSRAPTLKWKSMAECCADQVLVAEESYVKSMRNPSQYWREKYRLEQQIMHLLQSHLPPHKRFVVTPLMSPSPTLDGQVSTSAVQTPPPSISPPSFVHPWPNLFPPPRQNVYIQVLDRWAERCETWKSSAHAQSNSHSGYPDTPAVDSSNPRLEADSTIVKAESGQKRKRATLEDDSPRPQKQPARIPATQEPIKHELLDAMKNGHAEEKSPQPITIQGEAARSEVDRQSYASIDVNVRQPCQEPEDPGRRLGQPHWMKLGQEQQETRAGVNAQGGHVMNEDALSQAPSDTVILESLKRTNEQNPFGPSGFKRLTRRHSIAI